MTVGGQHPCSCGGDPHPGPPAPVELREPPVCPLPRLPDGPAGTWGGGRGGVSRPLPGKWPPRRPHLLVGLLLGLLRGSRLTWALCLSRQALGLPLGGGAGGQRCILTQARPGAQPPLLRSRPVRLRGPALPARFCPQPPGAAGSPEGSALSHPVPQGSCTASKGDCGHPEPPPLAHPSSYPESQKSRHRTSSQEDTASEPSGCGSVEARVGPRGPEHPSPPGAPAPFTAAGNSCACWWALKGLSYPTTQTSPCATRQGCVVPLLPIHLHCSHPTPAPCTSHPHQLCPPWALRAPHPER